MGKYIAVKDCLISLTPPSVSPCVQIISSPSTVMKVMGKGVYTSPLQIQISGYTNASGFVQLPTPMLAVINSTAKKNKSQGRLVMVEGDSSEDIIISGMIGQTAATVTVRAKIQNAGQTKVKAE